VQLSLAVSLKKNKNLKSGAEKEQVSILLRQMRGLLALIMVIVVSLVGQKWLQRRPEPTFFCEERLPNKTWRHRLLGAKASQIQLKLLERKQRVLEIIGEYAEKGCFPRAPTAGGGAKTVFGKAEQSIYGSGKIHRT